MASGNKQYGLILPGKKFNINEVKRPSVFNNNSDSDDEAKEMGSSDWIKKSFQKQASQSVGIRRQTEIDMRKAIEQDPTVYKYDEIYDEMEKKKLDEDKKKKDEKRKPRYIQSLLKKAELRKIENERRIERQVQKEREAEGEQFKDKETFVTSAYKKKLEEFKKLDEEEKHQDLLEEICDVAKQQDLGGFYRHLYRSTVDRDKNSDDKIDKKVETKTEEKKIEVIEDKSKSNLDKKSQREKRQYRKRKSSESSSLEEGERDSDSDTSLSSSSSSSSSSNDSKSSGKIEQKDDKKCADKSSKNDSPTKAKQKKIEDDEKIVKEELVDDKVKPSSTIIKDDNKKDDKPLEEPKAVLKEDKPKINIWEKRTVGSVFEAALKRYFERKAERHAMHGN